MTRSREEVFSDLRRHARIFTRYATYLVLFSALITFFSRGQALVRLRLPWWVAIGLFYLSAVLAALVWALFDPATGSLRRYMFQAFLVLLVPSYIIGVTLYPDSSQSFRIGVTVANSVMLGMFYGKLAWDNRLISRRELERREGQ